MNLNLLNTILSHLKQSNSEIEGVAVVSSDGLMIAADLPKHIDQSNLGSVAAAFLSLGIRTDKEVKKKGFRQVVINNNDGNVVMTCIDQEAILLVITQADVHRDQLQKVMNETVIRFKEVLKPR